ncbi:MAG: hypothetical protein L3J67_03665 [Hyphomicrobiaceae bacterium]|nr:hypothetical protein [Hyphomicrobiaceae bacterium]
MELKKISRAWAMESAGASITNIGNFFLRASLAREITLMLCIKVLALFLMSYLFFGAAHRTAVSPETISQHLLSQ